MRWAGEGPDLCSVRVDLLAPDGSSHWVAAVADALVALLPFGDGPPHVAGVDQGRGHEGRPVIGLTFLVRAESFADATRTAVEAGTAAGVDAGVGSRIYDVVLVPEAASTLPDAVRRIPQPD